MSTQGVRWTICAPIARWNPVWLGFGQGPRYPCYTPFTVDDFWRIGSVRLLLDALLPARFRFAACVNRWLDVVPARLGSGGPSLIPLFVCAFVLVVRISDRSIACYRVCVQDALK